MLIDLLFRVKVDLQEFYCNFKIGVLFLSWDRLSDLSCFMFILFKYSYFESLLTFSIFSLIRSPFSLNSLTPFLGAILSFFCKSSSSVNLCKLKVPLLSISKGFTSLNISSTSFTTGFAWRISDFTFKFREVSPTLDWLCFFLWVSLFLSVFFCRSIFP